MKSYVIPKKFTIGTTPYNVFTTKYMQSVACVGHISYSDARITLATHDNVLAKERTPQERYKTFWHEVVHGCLKDMGRDRLCANEKFVKDLTERLVGVMESARF